MATVINNPGQTETGTGHGVVIGILLVVFLGILFLLFGLPYLGNRGTGLPASNDGGASINVDLPGGNAGNGGASTGQ